MNFNQVIVLIIASSYMLPMVADANPSLSLQTIERMVRRSLPVQAALANIKAAQENVKETKDQGGLTLHTGINIGQHYPLVISNITPKYFGIDPQVSLSYPLLGANVVQQEKTYESISALSTSRATLLQTRLQVIDLADTAFLLYWQSKERKLLAENLVGQIKKWSLAAKEERISGSWSLADGLYFDRVQSQAVDAVNQAQIQEETALSALNSILGQKLGPFEPKSPNILQFNQCHISKVNDAAMASDPMIKTLLGQLNAIRAEQHLGPWRYIDATANVGAQSSYDPAGNRAGYTIAAGIQVNVPLDVIDADNAHISKLAAQAESLQLQILQARANVHQNLVAAMGDLRVARDDLVVAQKQVAVNQADWNSLHAMMQDGPNDVFRKSIVARMDWFQAETMRINAIAAVAAAAAKLRRLDPSACGLFATSPG
ncbi:TolC family protein [Acidithiobacillus sp.]|jgi:outer membrane protein TolC|uniref:TolC family protein n=1 Tax=Acidithiobacillus sp. TaxID=1872118 RepID=UPI0025B9CF53|nr:TolC family protein [Acidithiobacillus sp.]MCK9189690.1 TolC family protein [Acidithiobacillus sp.]MCK9359500.1 TolC family protein [Acidithiobacillus sp.]